MKKYQLKGGEPMGKKDAMATCTIALKAMEILRREYDCHEEGYDLAGEAIKIIDKLALDLSMRMPW